MSYSRTCRANKFSAKSSRIRTISKKRISDSLKAFTACNGRGKNPRARFSSCCGTTKNSVNRRDAYVTGRLIDDEQVQRLCYTVRDCACAKLPNHWHISTFAGGGARTHTLLPVLDFESSASASSATPAAGDGQITKMMDQLKRFPQARAVASFGAAQKSRVK